MKYEDLDFSLEEYEQLVLHHPDKILNNRHLFRWGLEHCFFILNKNESIQPLVFKEAQARLFNTYYDLKEAAAEDEIGAQIIILKSRQQGMTTLIAAIATFEMMLRENRTSLIVAHEKGDVATKIFKIYQRFMQYLPYPEWDLNKVRDGDGFLLQNGSSVDVSYEKGIRGITTSFMHLSEGGFFKDLSKFLGDFMPGLRKLPLASIIIESTAEKANDAYHHIWKEASVGKNAWHPVFYPWFIDEDNVKQIPDGQREAFETSLEHREDGTYGNELKLLEDYPDDITLEHLYKRRDLIDGLPHGLATFKREFPTTPEEAFMGVDRPVFDIPTLQIYEKEQVRDPIVYGYMEIGDEQMAHQQTKFIESPQGIVKIWEPPQPHFVYMMGSDHSEGMNDLNGALIAKQHPYEIVAEVIGYDGYNPIPREFARQMYHVGKWYNEAHIVPENNGPGLAVIDMLLEWGYPHLVSETTIFPDKGSSPRYGWRNDVSSRKKSLEVARDTIKQMGIKIPSIKLIRQLSYFATVTKGNTTKDQALRKGEHKASGEDIDQFSDDLVFAFLGLEHCKRALGDPKPMQNYTDTMKDAQGELWITETLPNLQGIFGEPVQSQGQPTGNWKDFA